MSSHGASFMPEGLSADRLRNAVGDLVGLVQSTTAAESRVRQSFANDSEPADRAFQQAKTAIDERLSSARQKIADEFQKRRKQIKTEAETLFAETKKKGK